MMRPQAKRQLTEPLVYVMDFAAVLAYVQCWTGDHSPADDTPSFIPADMEVVAPVAPSFPGEVGDVRQPLVAGLKTDRKAALAAFGTFQKTILAGDTCISSTAKSLTDRIIQLLGGNADWIDAEASGMDEETVDEDVSANSGKSIGKGRISKRFRTVSSSSPPPQSRRTKKKKT
jgi:hypothetical protein